MKKLFLIISMFVGILHASAQVHMNIEAGANFRVSGPSKVVMNQGTFVNNGSYFDSTGEFTAAGNVDFSGSGNSRFRNFIIDNGGFSHINSLISVYDTAILTSGTLDANNLLFIRSDVNYLSRMAVTGVLNNDIQGLKVFPSVTSGACPSFPADMKLNIYGPVVRYQWQNSPDSATWSNIPAATDATYGTSITATSFYRCFIRTSNSAYAQPTPGVKFTLTGSLPNAGTISGPATVDVANTITLTPSVGGGVWTSSNANASVNTSGIVTGLLVGTATISYTVTNSCGTASATHTVNVTTVPPAAITGTLSICAGTNTLLSNTTPGGAWSSSTPAVATIDPVSGMATGITAGTSIISYNVGGTAATAVLTVNAAPDAGTLSGPGGICDGATASFTSSQPGGVWSSSNTIRATIDGSGNVTGLNTGSLNIIYTASNSCGTSVASAAFMVNPAPSAISGPGTVCPGSLIVLTTTPAGGIWSSPDATVTVVPSNGKVIGVSPGTATISYDLSTGCSVTTIVTVTPAPPAISGTLAVCPGSTTALSNTVSGGTWASSSPAKGSIDPTTGELTGISSGVTIITYTASAGCYVTAAATISASPATITGALTMCTGTTSDLNCSTAGGLWTSDNTAIATINAANGIVTSVAGAGTTVISYTVAGLCPRVVTVSVADPSPNTGDPVICRSQPVAVAILSNATPGGVWSSSNTARININGTSGVMNGLSVGTAIITYTLNPGCYSTTIVTVNPPVATITGSLNTCPGSTSLLANTTPGGTWSSADVSVAESVGGTGVTLGIAKGSTTITYMVSAGCYKTTTFSVKLGPLPISGTPNLCVASTTNLTCGPAGGVWSSTNLATATINSTYGVLRGINTGTATISYRLSTGCATTMVVTVDPAVAPITGAANVCPGFTVDLDNVDVGGTWSTSNAIASVDAGTGTVTGLSSGTSVISYIVTPSCYATLVQTVYSAPGTINGLNTVCENGKINLTCGPAGGTWSSSDPVVANISSIGLIQPFSVGSTTITYQNAAGCYSTHVVDVIAAPTPITGSLSVCIGATNLLSATPAGGTWVSSNTVKATIDPSNGALTGMTTGNSSITYTAPNGCFVKSIATVNLSPATISGPNTVIQAATIALSSTPSGNWSSSNTAIATVNPGNGITRGITTGDATITFSLINGCFKTHDITVLSARPDDPLGDSRPKPGIAIFPNPSSGLLTVETSVSGNFSVHTIDGKQVARWPIESGSTQVNLPYDITPGIYLCHFLGDDGTEMTVRLVYQR